MNDELTNNLQEEVGWTNSPQVLNETHVTQALNLMQSAVDLYSQCKMVEEKTEQIRMWSEVKIAETVAKYRSCQEFLNYTFGERDKALSKHYDLLDKAVEDDNKELIVEALHGISGIVTASPLTKFEEFVKLYEDTSQPLLDF